jgi:hypothetical protein
MYSTLTYDTKNYINNIKKKLEKVSEAGSVSLLR